MGFFRTIFSSRQTKDTDMPHLKIVAIMGTNHASTTLLGTILGSTRNPADGFHIGEYHTFYSDKKRLKHCRKHNQEEPCPIWNDMPPPVGEETGYHHIAARAKTTTLIDSSKIPEFFMKQYKDCRRYGWEMIPIVCYRDPVSLGYSQWKRRKEDLDLCVRKLKSNIGRLSRAVKFAQSIKEDFIVLEGSLLVQNPADITKQVCELTGIPYFPGKENYWEFEHHHLWGNGRQAKHLKGMEPGGYIPQQRDPAFPEELFLPLAEEYKTLFGDLEQRKLKLPESLAKAS